MAEPVDLLMGCGLRWAKGSTYQFSCIRQVAPMCSHGRAHLHHLANVIELYAVVMRPYVKLFWPLVYTYHCHCFIKIR